MKIRLGFVSNSSSSSFFTENVDIHIHLEKNPKELLKLTDTELETFLFGKNPDQPMCVHNENLWSGLHNVANTPPKKGELKPLDTKTAVQQARDYLTRMKRSYTDMYKLSIHYDNDDPRSSSPYIENETWKEFWDEKDQENISPAQAEYIRGIHATPTCIFQNFMDTAFITYASTSFISYYGDSQGVSDSSYRNETVFKKELGKTHPEWIDDEFYEDEEENERIRREEERWELHDYFD